MPIANAFEKFSNILRQIESGGWGIEHVEIKEKKLKTEEPLKAEIGISVPLLDTLQDETDVHIEGLNIENPTSVVNVTIPVTKEHDADGDPSQENAKKVEGDDIANEDWSEGQGTSERRLTDGQGEVEVKELEESRPAHHDPERLREVYEEHETFAEMTDALGVDVSPQTVRHFMIRHEIHEPSTHSSSVNTDTDDDSDRKKDSKRLTNIDTTDESEEDTNVQPSTENDNQEKRSNDDPRTTSSSGNSANEDEQDRTDEKSERDSISNGEIDAEQLEDITLPNHVSIEDVKNAVQSSSTVREVQLALDLDVSETRNLLRELNLLDLVTGRLAYKPNQDQQLDQIKKATDSTKEIEKRIYGALNYQTSANRAD